METTPLITEQPSSDQSNLLTGGPSSPQGLAEQAAGGDASEIHVALNELDRLAKAAREAMFKCEKYRALSSLVAIPPLVSHIMDTCSQMSTDTSSRQASECRAGSEG